MNILMIGLFTNNTFDGCEALAKGFEALGHNVTRINYRKTSFINFKLPRLAKNHDVLLIGKGDEIWPLTLKKIKIPKALYYIDQRDDIQKWVVNRARQCDLFLHTTAGDRLVEYYQHIKRPTAYFMVPSQPDLFQTPLKYNTDIFFSGSNITNFGDPIRKDVLSALSEYRNFKWDGLTPETVIRGHAHAEQILKSKILISINHFNGYYKCNSNRLINYASGGFVLAYESHGLKELFDHIPTFKTVDSMKQKIEYFLSNDEEREAIKKQIMCEAHNKYNNKKMCQYILDCLLNGQSSIYNQFEFIK